MKKSGFTLIELMVVVAVIAILATLSVTSFSAAIKRTRNAGRQSDIQAVTKALETCYDVPSGTYLGLDGTNTAENNSGNFDTIVNSLVTAGCLNETIKPGMEGKDYTAWTTTTDGAQGFMICADLEYVANWDSVGNTQTLPTSTTFGEACDPTDNTTSCYFCARNQQ